MALIDEHGLYLMCQCHPGSPRYAYGVAMNHLMQVDRQSVFGYALARLLCVCRDSDARESFIKIFAIVVSLPNKYNELIEVISSRPNSIAVTSQAITLPKTIQPIILDARYTDRLDMTSVVLVMMRNGITPDWVKHAYPFGVMYLEVMFHEELLPLSQLIEIDDDRLDRLRRFGIPGPISDLPHGWRYPTSSDVLRMYSSFSHLATQNNDDPRNGHYWLPAGTTIPYERLLNRPPVNITDTSSRLSPPAVRPNDSSMQVDLPPDPITGLDDTTPRGQTSHEPPTKRTRSASPTLSSRHTSSRTSSRQ
jgi:hypothetical protein